MASRQDSVRLRITYFSTYLVYCVTLRKQRPPDRPEIIKWNRLQAVIQRKKKEYHQLLTNQPIKQPATRIPRFSRRVGSKFPREKRKSANTRPPPPPNNIKKSFKILIVFISLQKHCNDKLHKFTWFTSLHILRCGCKTYSSCQIIFTLLPIEGETPRICKTDETWDSSVQETESFLRHEQLLS